MAFELQTAWDEAESWGAHQVLKELDSKWFANETSEVLKKIKGYEQSGSRNLSRKTAQTSGKSAKSSLLLLRVNYIVIRVL